MARNFKELMEEVAPPWLLTTNGRPFMRALGVQKDALTFRARQAVNLRFPRLMTADAAAALGADRGLPRAYGETLTQYTERLRKAWDAWGYAGTARGLLTALVAAGYTNAQLVIANQRRYTMGADYVLHSYTLPAGSFRLRSGPHFWSEFALLFPNPLPESWQTGGIPAESSDEAKFIKALVQTWKPGHMRLADIAIEPLTGGGELWGYPEGRYWNLDAPLGHEQDASTAALYRMDEASGDLVSVVPSGVSMVASGTVGAVTGKISGGRSIGTDTSHWARTLATYTGLYTALTTGPFSVELWLNLNGSAPPANRYVWALTSSLANLQITSARTLTLTVGGQATSSAAGAMPLTGWNHIGIRAALSGSQRVLAIFVNGVQSGTGATITPAFGASVGFYVGFTSTSLIAQYDDLRISTVARTDSEFLDSYARGIGGVWGAQPEWTHWAI